MPAKRSKNAANARRQPSAPRPAAGTTASDILGLSLAVVAIAMMVALLMPADAPITRAVAGFLTLSFGRGALLVPLALFGFAVTFFVEGDDPLGMRMAFGLALSVTAVLSLVSLNSAGNATTADLVVSADFVVGSGGYVGGGVAWACLSFVGRSVGNVLLIGFLIGGIVICGFSISGAVTRFRGHAHDARARMSVAHEGYVAARAERRAAREAASQGRPVPAGTAAGAQVTLLGAPDVTAETGATTFLGARKTSVLTREPKGGLSARGRHPALEVDVVETDGAPKPTEAEAATTLLAGRTRLEDPGLTDALQDTKAVADGAVVAIPDFLRNAVPATSGPAPDTARPSAASTVVREPRAGTRAHPQRRERKVSSAAPAARPSSEASVRPGEGDDAYELPPFSMLSSNPHSAQSASSAAELDETMARLQSTLVEFGLTSRVVDYVSGPLVTTFQIEMGEGERVSRITNLEDDIALSLAAESVRIFAPIPGTSRVGIEIPNKARQNVHLGDVLPSATGGPLEFALGRDAEGAPVTADLASMPHLLVAGATGSGKSVMINSLIMSLLMRTTPKQVRLILVDPKRVEFSGYNGLPHLYVPVVTEPRQAASALQWAVSEMERRLKVFERAGARNIGAYNEMCVSGRLAEMEHPPEPMPFMVIIIDELSDLMMVAGKDVEASIVRIAQLARAAGIHLVLATQRPSANVVTGLIKSNVETRIALSVASSTDSRVILDATGAQRLLGNGDMLFKARGNRTRRVLGCYVSDPEIEQVVDFIRGQAEPDYHEEILSAIAPGVSGEDGVSVGEDDDPLVWEAARIVVESQLGSTSGLQRRLKVGYARAGRIMDMLEAKGVVGPVAGSKPRDVLLDTDALEELMVLEERYREV